MEELQSEFAQQLLRQIEAIERKDWYRKPDRFGREHTNITNLTSELRQFLSFHGDPLENVDTANSQPIFLGLSIKKAIKQEQEEPEDNMPYCSACCADDDDSVINEVGKYLQWCEEGIYDKLAIRTGQPRAKVKKDMFAGVLFNKENNWRNTTAEAFEEEFPQIRQELRNMKTHGYQKVAHQMQRTEAAFMFTRVVPRLLQENPQMPLFTLHDSIICRAKHNRGSEVVGNFQSIILRNMCWCTE